MTDDFKVKVTADTTQAESDIDRLVKKYEGKKVKLNIDTGGADKNLSRAGSSANSLSESMGNVAKNAVLATASYKAFNFATQQLKEAVSSVEELNEALTNVHMTMQQMTGMDLSNLKSQILDMSNELSAYAKTVSDAVKIYANANESINTIMQKTEPTVLLATASGKSASDAADTVQGILNQFKMTDDAAMGVVDTLEGLSAEMKMDFAKGIQNVSDAVKVSGSVINNAGMSFERYASIVSSAAESTRLSGSVLGNAFKTISSRIGRSKDGEATDAERSKAEEAYNSIGVSIRNADGDIRDLSETLDDLSKVWGTLSRSQRNYIAEQSAGMHRISIFTNIMDNYSRALELEQTALNSSGMAMKVNEVRANSIDGKLQKLSSTMTQLYNDAVSEEAIMSVIDFADALAKVADNLGLLKGAFAALGAAGIAKGIGLIASNWQTILGLLTSPVTAVVAGVGAAVSIYSALKQRQKEMMSAAREEATAWQESNTSLQSHIEKVTELKAQLESGNLTEEESYNVKSQLLDIQNQLIDTYGQMASGIDLVNGSLETQISLMNQISAEEANKYLTENKRSIEKAEKAMEKNRKYFVNTYGDDNTQRLQAVKDAIAKNGLKGVTNDDGSISISFEGMAADAEKALNGFASDIRDIQKQYGDYGFLEIMLNNIESKVGDAKDILDEYQDIYNTARTAELSTDKTKISTSYNGDRTYSDVAKDYADAIEEYNKALMNLDDAESLDSAEQKFNAVQMAVDQIIASVPGYATVFDGLREQLNEAAIQTVNLNDALKDGSSKGLKTYADKIKKLNINDKEFIASLNDADSATGELSTSLVEAAQSAGLIGSSDVEVQKLIDALINAGIIAGQTSEAVKEAFDINATPLLDAYNKATESENQGDNYLKFAEALEKAKEDYNKGLVGTDDFKSAAKMFSPTGMDDAANFEENYNRIKKYFDKDSAKGVQAFLKDLEALNKGYAEFDKSTGTWTTDFDDLEQAAKDMGMGFEPFMAVLKRMDDYGASSNFFATTKEGMDHLSELYRELAQEEMTLAQLKQTDPNNKTAIDATQEKIDTLKSSIQESIKYLEQLTNMEAKDFDAQVTGAKEAYESLRQQRKKVLKEGGENAQSVAQMIEDQMGDLVGQYHLEIDAEGNIVTVNPPEETPEVEVEANLQPQQGYTVPQDQYQQNYSGNGTVNVTADNSEVNAKIQESVDEANESTGTVKIDGDNEPAIEKTDETVKHIDSQTGQINIEVKTDNINDDIQKALDENSYKVNVDVSTSNTGGTSGKAKNKKDNKTSETETSKNGLSSSTGTVSINKTGSSKKVETEKNPETEVKAKVEVPEKIETEKTPETEVKADIKTPKKVEPETQPETEVKAEVKVPKKVEPEETPKTKVKADVKVPEKIKSEKTPETEVKAKVKVPEKVETEKTPEAHIPMASIKNLNNNGWNFESDNEDTLLAVPKYDYKKKNSSDSSYMGVVINPVLPNGKILSPDETDKYINDIFENKEIDPDIQFTLFEEKDFGSLLDTLDYLQDAFWGLAYRGKKENVLNSLESIRKNGYTSEQLKNIDFNDDKIVDGEKEVNSLLQALDLTKDHASALIQILEQIGFFEIPIEVQDVPEDKVSSEARKVQDELNQNPVKVPVTTETQVPVKDQNSTPSTTSVIKVQADTTDANESIQKTKETANETTGSLKIDGDDKPAKTKTDETVKHIDSQTGHIKIEPKTDNLNNNIQNALNGKTFKINADVNVNVRNTGDNSGKSKQASVNGTPFITSARFNDGYLGVAHANGTVGEKKDIDALTGELGEELVVRGNRFFTVGKNGAEMVHLKKGDIVFNHEQTKQLLSRGYINGRGKALAQGNARSGTGGNALKFQGGAAGNKLDDKSTKESTKEKDKNTKSVKRSTQVFDWVAKRLEYFANKTKRIADTITDYVQLAFKKAQLNKQIDAINKEITANTRGANAYLRKADNVAKNYKYYDDNGKEHSVSVSAQYKKLVQQGKYKKIKYKIEEMDTSKEEKAALAEAIQKYDDYYNKSQECKQAVIDLRNEQLELYEQWVNIPTEQAEKKIDSLDLSLKQLERDFAKLGNYNVSAMNKNIDQQTENARKQNNEYQKALKEANDNFDNADNNYSNKKTALLKNKKLSDKQKKAIENGNEISTVGITDKKLLKQVNAYNTALQKKTIATDAQSEALKNATESEKNYYETMQANSQTKFDNIATAYENQIAALEHTGNMMNAYMNRAETMGFIMSKKYYQILQNVEASNLEQLKQEKAALIASLEESVRNGSIVKYSTDWYDMKSKIDDVTESIEESTTAMIEYNNSIRDLDWQIFDLIQERISYVTDEADFLINLMSNSKLYEDNGQLTDKGTATMGLHGLNYNVAMAQADDYAKKIAELDAEIASSQEKANDQNLLKKRQEYIELQRDSILAAEDEKQAIKDMVSEGIEKELDALKELIDKYNEVMDSQKDLYDYQKKIKDQTKEIAKLEKQLAVYKGDKSEEVKATVQKIKVSLEDARENLKESEYDKYVSDQKKLLDDLYSEYEDVLNERMDDLDTLIQDMINQLNDEESTINKTIRGVASNVGVDLSSEMKKIWDGDTTLSSVLKSYSTDFSKLTTISDTLTGIKEDIAKMVINSDKKAEEQTKDGVGNASQSNPDALSKTQLDSEVKKSASSASSNVDTLGKNIKNGGGSTSTNGKSDPANTLMAVDSANTLKSKVTALFKTLKSKKLTKKELDKHSSLFKHIYNKTNNRNITDDKILTLGKTLGVKNLPKKAENLTAANKKEILNKLRTIGGYKTGTRSVLKDGYAWTQEDGQEFIIRKKDGGILTPVKREDMIFNKAASKNLYDFANNPPGFINGLSGIGNVDIPASVVNRNITGDSHDNINITLSFPNVQNYEELKYSLQHDPHFEKMLRAMTTDKLFGGSSLKKYK